MAQRFRFRTRAGARAARALGSRSRRSSLARCGLRKGNYCSSIRRNKAGEVVMMAAGEIAAMSIALACGSAVCATPAAAEVIEFALSGSSGLGPEVELQSYQLGTSMTTRSFTVTALLDRSTDEWRRDVTTGHVFPAAVLTVTGPPTVLTIRFSDVIAASASESSGSSLPIITATFDYRTIIERFSTVPEPSTWAMMLLGFGGLAIGGYAASRRRRSKFA
jgi:PEP-CTERM motif